VVEEQARSGLLSLPKVELHLHLDISISYRVARRLVPDLSLDRYRRELQGPDRCSDLAAFLSTTSRQVELLQSAEALRWLTTDLLATLAAEGVAHAELRFAPLLHVAGALSPEAAVETVLTAGTDTAAALGMSVSCILASLRHFDAESSLRTARLAARYHGATAVGFDLAGDEAGFPLRTHLPAFAVARDAGVPLTVHAGEGAGPESVREVLREIAPARIGHGVRAAEDRDLVDHLAEAGTHLELCPSCNVQLGVVPDLTSHPIDRLLRRGVSLSVSTDNRTSTVTTLPTEYERLAAAFGWGPEDFRATNAMAARAAFLSDEERSVLVERVSAASGDGAAGAHAGARGRPDTDRPR
jgi:adenosine deaminase